MAKILIGTVVSTKMQKTIIVMVTRRFRHSLYKKVITINKRYKVHCENQNIKEGDVVTIQETKPISKDKHFRLMHKGEATKEELKHEVTNSKAVAVTAKEDKQATEKAEAEIKVAKEKKTKTEKPKVKSKTKKAKVK